MPEWTTVSPVAVGGLVAVGFLDEERVAVGSHSGLAVLEAATGTRLDRVLDRDGDYAWFREKPPAAVYTDHDGQHVVEVAGLWGGTLPAATRDGWSCPATGSGAELANPTGVAIAVEDTEELRAIGFSPHGRVLVFATASTLHIAVRT